MSYGRRPVYWINTLLQDFRFAVRLWRTQPGAFLAAVVALTLGMGLVAFSFCAIDCVFFGRVPLPEPEQIVYTTIPAGALHMYQEQATTFAELCAFSSGSANFKAIDAPSPRSVCYIGPNFLQVTRGETLLGRGFRDADARPGAEPVALIGYGLWQEEFRGSASALGAVIHLNGQPRTVIGIMPSGFKFPINDELWLPAEPDSPQMSGWGFVFGRLKPPIRIADARAELNVIAAREASGLASWGLASAGPIKIGPFTRFAEMKGAFGPAPSLMAMLVVTSLVLFIACANVAGLILAKATKRATELAIRGTLGASRGRLIGQMLIENLILAATGAFGALLVIAALTAWFRSWLMSNNTGFSQMPYWMQFRIDGKLVLAVIGLSLLSTILTGLWPALQATRRDVNELLKAGTAGVAASRATQFHWLLATVQVAFSAIVLIQSLVLVGFSRRLMQAHLPFDPSAVLSARVDSPTPTNAIAFFEQLERNLAALPGVQAASVSTGDPSGRPLRQIAIEGIEYSLPERRPYVGTETVSTGFFPALNIPLRQGRGFTAADAFGSLPVAVVNEAFAKRFLPPSSPLGHRFREGTNSWLTVVGCVADVRYDPANESPEPVYYVPVAQESPSSMTILLRGAGRATDWTRTLRAEVERLQPDLPIYRVATFQMLINHQIIGYYLASLLLAICGGGSLFLATLGIFGLITLSVHQRTAEIGVCLALGASRGRIIARLMKRAVGQIIAGLVAGGLAAVALSRLVTHSIAGYPTAIHPVLLVATAIGFLGTISVSAVLIPAIRGARLDPMVALRTE